MLSRALKSLTLVGVATASAIATLAFLYFTDDDAVDRFGFSSKEVPAEYHYLDSDRVTTYLAQIQGGISESETLTFTDSSSLKASLEGSGQVGGGQSRELSIRRTVLPTDAANFLRLLTLLRDGAVQDPVRFKEINARSSPEEFSLDVLGLKTGDFVAIHDVRVLMPFHARPFDALRRLGVAAFANSDSERRQIEDYLKIVGEDPRVIFNIGAHGARDTGGLGEYRTHDEHGLPWQGKPALQPGCPCCPSSTWRKSFNRTWPVHREPAGGEELVERINARVLVPVNYAGLSSDRSVRAGGTSTVVGKVVQVLHPPERTPRPAPRFVDVCYEDDQALAAFQLAQSKVEPPWVRWRL